MFLGIAPADAQVAHPRARGSMTIDIAALPAALRAAVTLRGPAGSRAFVRTTTLRHLPSGTYVIKARPVSTRTKTFYPTLATCADLGRCSALAKGRVRLRGGAHLKLAVVYQDIVPKTTKVLSKGLLKRLRTGSRPNGKLVFKGRAHVPLAAGSVVVSPPSPALPYGLLRRVSRVTEEGNQTTVSTTPATLLDAVPRGAFDITSASMVTKARVGVGARQSDSTSSISLSRPGSRFSCGGGAGGSVSASLNLPLPRLRFSASWGSGSHPAVAIAATLAARASSSLSLRKGAACSWGEEFPRSPNPGKVLPEIRAMIGPVPVWFTPELVMVLGGTEAATSAMSFSTTETASVTAGVNYKDGKFHSGFDKTHSRRTSTTSPGISGEAELKVGVKVYFDFFKKRLFACQVLGNCDYAGPSPYVNVTLGPKLKVNPSTIEPWWRLDGGLDFGVGLNLTTIGLSSDASKNFELLTYPLTAPPGRPTDVTATAGDESAKISWQPPPVNPAPPKEEKCACEPVSGYTVYVDGKLWSRTEATSITLDGLTNGRSYAMTITANSAAGFPLDSLQTQPVTVTPGNGTITIDPLQLQAGVPGVRYRQVMKASGGTGPLTWSITGTLPVSLSLNTETGVIEGTPTNLGKSPVTIRVHDDDGNYGSRQYTLVIGPPACTGSPCAIADGNGEVTVAWAPCSCAIYPDGPYEYLLDDYINGVLGGPVGPFHLTLRKGHFYSAPDGRGWMTYDPDIFLQVPGDTMYFTLSYWEPGSEGLPVILGTSNTVIVK